MLVRMRFENLTEQEYTMIRGFLNWICDKIFIYLNRAANRRRIEARLEYIKKVKWVEWVGSKDLTTDELLLTIRKSLKIRKKRTMWEIIFDNNVLMPGTRTPVTKFLRFLDNGDNIVKGTGMVQFVRRKFTHLQLNKWWKAYIMMKTSSMTDGKIISD